MTITLRRRPLTLALLLLAGVIVLLALPPTPDPRGPTGPSAPPDLLTVARDLATAFGQGDLYRSPDRYPLTDALKASIAQRPNRGQDWPAFVGLTGPIVVVLSGQDVAGQAFTDVVAHVVSRGTWQSIQLTQVEVRLVKVGDTWRADRLFTLTKGAIQP